jgi:hypothetical protein
MLKIYACFMFLVISSHICVLIFKTCPFMTYICTASGPMPKSFDYQLFGQFLNFPELPRQFKPDMSGLLAQTYPAPCPDMSGYQASGYVKRVCTPSNPKPTKSSPLLSCDSQDSHKVILDLLHRILPVSRRFGSPTPCDLQTLVGFLSPKVYSRFLNSSSISYNALFHMPWSTSMIYLPCLEILSRMNFHILQVED